MVNKVSYEVEQQVLAMNGKYKQEEVAKVLNISLPTVRHICKRNKVVWIWKFRDQSGENNHNYQGGLGRSTIERLTRRIVIASGRCLHTCERCGDFSEEKDQTRHHKDRNRSNNSAENIEVLCQTCHVTEHNKDRIRGEDGQYIG